MKKKKGLRILPSLLKECPDFNEVDLRAILSFFRRRREITGEELYNIVTEMYYRYKNPTHFTLTFSDGSEMILFSHVGLWSSKALQTQLFLLSNGEFAWWGFEGRRGPAFAKSITKLTGRLEEDSMFCWMDGSFKVIPQYPYEEMKDMVVPVRFKDFIISSVGRFLMKTFKERILDYISEIFTVNIGWLVREENLWRMLSEAEGINPLEFTLKDIWLLLEETKSLSQRYRFLSDNLLSDAIWRFLSGLDLLREDPCTSSHFERTLGEVYREFGIIPLEKAIVLLEETAERLGFEVAGRRWFKTEGPDIVEIDEEMFIFINRRFYCHQIIAAPHLPWPDMVIATMLALATEQRYEISTLTKPALKALERLFDGKPGQKGGQGENQDNRT